MTSRARRLLVALEDGCSTRDQIFAHAGRFMLCNNAASELRRAGVDVLWDHATDTYHLTDGGLSGPARVAPTLPVDVCATANAGGPAEPTIEQPDGQLALEVAA